MVYPHDLIRISSAIIYLSLRNNQYIMTQDCPLSTRPTLPQSFAMSNSPMSFTPHRMFCANTEKTMSGEIAPCPDKAVMTCRNCKLVQVLPLLLTTYHSLSTFHHALTLPTVLQRRLPSRQLAHPQTHLQIQTPQRPLHPQMDLRKTTPGFHDAEPQAPSPRALRL